jgi:hypothetical protein
MVTGDGAVAAVAFAQLGRTGDQQGVDLVGRGGVRLDRAAPRAAIRAADLGHLDTGGLQHSGQARAVTRRPFRPDDRDATETARPSQRVIVAARARRNSASANGFPVSVMTA